MLRVIDEGDDILGFMARNRGMSVHRTDCPRLAKLRETAADRVVTVGWDSSAQEHYEVDIAIVAHDGQGLLRDITSIFANARLNVLAINTQSHRDSNTATMRLSVEVPNLGSLSKLLERIGRLPTVMSVERLSD